MVVVILTAANGNAQEIDGNYYFNNFYKEKNYSISDKLLKWYLTNNPTINQNHYWSSAYFFSQIAKDSSTIDSYFTALEKANPEQKVFILDVLSFCYNSDIQTNLERIRIAEKGDGIKDKIDSVLAGNNSSFDPLKRVVAKSNDLDMLWTKFFVTGNTEAVKKIICVLDKPDLIREKLDEYLKYNPDDNKAKIVIRQIGIIIDERNTIVDIDDLDILMAMKLRQGTIKSEFKVFRELLKVGNDDIYHLALKGAAFWSLQSNAEQHELVRSTCVEAATDKSRKAHTMLKILLASMK